MSVLPVKKRITLCVMLLIMSICFEANAVECGDVVNWSAKTVFDKGVFVQQSGKKYRALVRSRAFSPEQNLDSSKAWQLVGVCRVDVVSKSDCGGPWYSSALTNYESYPEPRSDECTLYNGCKWAGWFYGLPDRQPESWVIENNIVAVHAKDWKWLGMKTINLRQGDKRITAKVYDACDDSDCNGCCTANLAGAGFLIDIEKYTMSRFGSGSGIVEFQVCN